MGKWAEFRELLSAYGIEASLIRAELREIQSSDVAEIARVSVEEALDRFGDDVIVEDAGLYIDALHGFPGPYSSYVYKTIGLSGVLKLMEGKTARSASFVSALAYASRLRGILVFKGVCRGEIAHEQRGTGGFGFDPIFIPEEGDGRTFAEISLEEKNRISHRYKSTREFASWYISHL